MIPPLPLELVSHILDLATSPSYAVSSRADDRLLLRRCCLVSRQFCAAAQPKLWSVVVVKKGASFSFLSHPQHPQHARVPEDQHASDSYRVVNAVKVLPVLIEVRVMQGTLTGNDVGSFSTSHCRASPPSSSTNSLPSRSHPPSRNNRGMHSLPRPSQRSAALSTSGFHDYDSGFQAFLEPVNLPHGQLEVLQVHPADCRVFPADLRYRGAAVMLPFDIGWTEWVRQMPECHGFEHFLVEVSHPSIGQTLSRWASLETLLKARPGTKSLSLFSTFNPSTALPSSLAAARDKVLETCCIRNITVIWRPYSRAEEDDVGVSRDFWEYAKELKRKKQLAAEEGSG